VQIIDGVSEAAVVVNEVTVEAVNEVTVEAVNRVPVEAEVNGEKV
jgi:hypothetical protein